MILAQPLWVVLPSLTVLILLIAFSLLRGSILSAIFDLLSLTAVVVSWLFSLYSSLVGTLGAIFPFNSAIQWVFNKYPGAEFAKEQREEFTQRAVDYLEREGEEIEQTPNQLARELQMSSKSAGRQLSDGEAVFGFTLATVGYFSIGSNVLLTVLSVGLALAVTARLTALNSVLFEHRQPELSPKRMFAMIAWNRAMASGVKIISSLAMLRFIQRIDDRLYQVYLNRVLDESLKGNSGRIRTATRIFRPLMAIILAKDREISLPEASRELFDENVFEDDHEIDDRGSGD